MAVPRQTWHGTREVIQSDEYLFKTVDMTDSAEDDGMMCGGTMNVFIEAV
ncbi:MAG: hypothetical protein LBS00_03590 [Synergistaceae bacterium]|nr:hypothetical protein [Synergistaceae bacterium]